MCRYLAINPLVSRAVMKFWIIGLTLLPLITCSCRNRVALRNEIKEAAENQRKEKIEIADIKWRIGNKFIVKISNDNEITMYEKPVPLKDIVAELNRQQVPKGIPAELDVANRADMKVVVSVLEALIEYGFKEVNFAGAVDPLNDESK
jgi:biopolymer transport protein ExbD